MKKPNDCNLWRRFVFLFCASLVACQAAFGDYKSGNSTLGVGGGGGAGGIGNAGNSAKAGNANGGGTSGGACNSEGIYRCTDTAVEVCTNHQWKGLIPCTRDLCDADRGRCMTCAPGSHRCSAFNLQTCASTGDFWKTDKPCDTAAYCDSVTNACFACLAGEAFCSGASLYRCNVAKDGWNVEECGSSDLCDANAQTCGEACPSTDWVSCNGATLIGCDGNGHHTVLDTCASSQLCQKTLTKRADNPSAWNGKCEVGCTPNAYQCNPDNLAELRACPPSGLGWEHIETCATPELCDPANKQCKPGCGAPPGTYQCTGSRLEQCRDDGSAFEVIQVCENENRCNTQKHACIPCVPGEFQCTNATLQRCNDDLTWTTIETCASVALCDATHGKCVSANCSKAGSFECSGANLLRCRTDLTGWDTQNCTTPALCDAANGRCVAPECQSTNAYRCQNNTRQICDDATRRWVDVNTCESDEVCDLTAASGCMRTCPPIPWRCNTEGTLSLTAIQSCSMVNGVPKWTTVGAPCATADLCEIGDAGATCLMPTCSADQYFCDSNTLKVCNAGRNGWVTADACGATEICDATGRQCDICVANTYTCHQINNNVSRQLLKCDSTGQSSTVATNGNCDSGALCYTSADGLTGYCRCEGETRCNNGQVVACSSDGHTWNTTGTPCANGCIETQDYTTGIRSAFCAACAANEVQCVQTSPPGTLHTCASDRKSWGNTTACSQGLGCVENGTSDYCASTCSPNAWACVSSTGTSTAKHQCNADGKGWGSSIAECADDKSLKVCTGGQLSSTSSSACPSATPYCLATTGKCVECLNGAIECNASNQLLKCVSNKWVATTCTGDTPICSGNTCVACLSSSSPSSCNVDGTVLTYCASDNTWKTTTCLSPTPLCRDAKCVACDRKTYVSICSDGTTVQSCPEGSLVSTLCSGDKPVCFAASGATAVCAACNGDTKPICLDDGVTRRACVNGVYADTLCTGANSNYCLDGNCAGCNATAPARCSTGTIISMCNTSSGTWDESACLSPKPVCDDQNGSGALCVECHNTTGWQCVGNTRHSCSNNKNVDEPCPSDQICDPADVTCKAPTCTPNEFGCDGSKVRQCNQYGTAWTETGTVCSGVTPFCQAGTGTCVGCMFPSDCSGTKPICDDGECVGCSSAVPVVPCPAGTCQTDGSCLVSDAG